MTVRLSKSSLTGTERTLVAVGTVRLTSMFWAVRAAAPRNGMRSTSPGPLGASAPPELVGAAGGGVGGVGDAAGAGAAGAGAGAADAAGAAELVEAAGAGLVSTGSTGAGAG